MKLIFLLLIVFSSTSLLQAQNWEELTYNHNVAKIEENPMKGWMPGYKSINSNFPYSIDHFYIRLNKVYKDWGECDWTEFEKELDFMLGKGCHSVVRFWIDYPNQEVGMPDFLLDDTGHKVPMWDENSPNWNDDTLMVAMEEFIAMFGERYDGDPRIAYIEAGLYGFWGEWHTHPNTSWQMTQSNKDRLLTAYKNAFSTTHIGLRQSNHASTYDLKMSVGYYDDSFAYNTLCTGGWCSWNGNLVPDGITDNYKYHPFAGELRPEIQSTIFDAWPNGTGNGEEDLETCIKSTRLSFMKAYYLYNKIPTETEFANALRSHKMMGYEFFVSSAKLTADALSNVNVDVKIENTGIAPFYYNWEVEFAAKNSSGLFLGSIGKTDWQINTIYPDSAAYTKSFSTTIYGNDTYLIMMRFVNPLEEMTDNAHLLRFANETQDQDQDGWLTLGEVTINADDVDVTGVSIADCPADSIPIGATHTLSASVEPFNATNKKVYWHSSEPSVASINDFGEITALSIGETVVTLYNSDSTLNDECIIKVKNQVILHDSLISVKVSDYVIPGDTLVVSVEYKATEARDVRAFLQLNSPPWSTYGSKTITVPRGAETVHIAFKVDESVPIVNDAYKIVINLLPVGGGWPERIHEITISKVDVVMPLEGVSLNNCPADSIAILDSHQLGLIFTPENASDKSVSWTSSNTSIATVSSNGEITGVAKGTAVITVVSNDGGFTDQCEVKVFKPAIPVTGVDMTGCPSGNFRVGDTAQLNASVNPANADDNSISWSSDKTDVASVNENGLVTALSVGEVIITATANDGGFSETCTLIVKEAIVKVTEVILTGCFTDSLKLGETFQFGVEISPENATDLSVTWASSNQAVLAVDEQGMISAITVGEATISVTSNDGDLSDECFVVVVDTATVNNTSLQLNESGTDIYPNPFDGQLFFSFTDAKTEKSISIYNMDGRLLVHQKVSGSRHSIEMQKYAKYRLMIVEVSSSKGSEFFKVIAKTP